MSGRFEFRPVGDPGLHKLVLRNVSSQNPTLHPLGICLESKSVKVSNENDLQVQLVTDHARIDSYLTMLSALEDCPANRNVS